MKALLHTTIGPVQAKLEGHCIEIYTSEESYREGLINLWDYEKGTVVFEPGLRDFISLVCAELRNHFEDFALCGPIEVEASDDELKL